MGGATASPLSIELSDKEILRNLGYRRGRQPAERIRTRIDELRPVAQGLMRPHGAFRIVAGGHAEAAGMPRISPRVGVGVCTIGHALEREVERQNESGELLDALLLDAFGSAGAEAAADALNRALCVAARREGLYAAPRVSPGYGRWDIKGQTALLALLPIDDLGMELTSGLMMVPRKSVSFGVRLGDEPGDADTRARRCARCGMRDCAYRAEDRVVSSERGGAPFARRAETLESTWAPWSQDTTQG